MKRIKTSVLWFIQQSVALGAIGRFFVLACPGQERTIRMVLLSVWRSYGLVMTPEKPYALKSAMIGSLE